MIVANRPNYYTLFSVIDQKKIRVLYLEDVTKNSPAYFFPDRFLLNLFLPFTFVKVLCACFTTMPLSDADA